MTEQTIFLSALDIPDAATRAAYVESACAGDATLRRQVDALLTAHERSGLFLDEPAVAQLSAPRPAAESDTVTAEGEATGGRDPDLRFLSPPTRPGSLGRLAHYEVLEVLGRGGFGTVLRAFDDHLHRVVAIKVLSPQLATSGTARARFRREAKSGAAVRDEHVVHIYAVADEDEPVPYLVMEYIAGQTLQQKLDRTGPLPVHEMLRIGQQVARGLAAAHATGLIHRDVKPSNILLENGVERVKLTDFGLAKVTDDASISHSGLVAGTPMYMAPEQAQGVQIDFRADLFSLGSVLYAMCTGRPPFRATTTLAVLKRVCEEDPRQIREINPEVPEWLCDVIAKLHAKKPDDRFQSANEVADLLQHHLAHLRQPNLVVPPPAVVAPSPLSRQWQAGDRVLAPWEPEWLYPATVQQTNADSVQLAYDDGDSTWLNVAALRPLDIEKGSRVCGWWNGPYYPGTVTERDGNRVHIAYDDGDNEWTDLSYIRVAATRTSPVELPAPAPRHRRRRSKWVVVGVALALVLVLVFGAVRYGNSAMLYAANEGELELVPEDGLTSLIVMQNPEGVYDGKVRPLVTDWLGMKTNHKLKLPPGKYQLNAGTWPAGIRFIHWRVTTTGVFRSQTLLMPAEGSEGWSTIVTVERGCRVSVRPVVIRTPPPTVQTQDADGFVQLFNGRDLTGWYGHALQTGNWRVENGILVGSGATSYLFSPRGDFKDFHLRCRVRINDGGDSGVIFRCDKSRTVNLRPAGYEAQINANAEAILRTGSLHWSDALYMFGKDLHVKPNEWFTYEIVARGNRLQLKVNGEQTLDWTDASNRGERGHIALQLSGDKTVVEFQSIEIKELPASEPATPPAAVAPFDAAKAKEHQVAWAKHLGVPVEFTNSVGITFRLIPPGEFMMGSSKEEVDVLLKTTNPIAHDRLRSEYPKRREHVREPYYLSVHETTCGQFAAFATAAGYLTADEKSGQGGIGRDPVKQTNSRDAANTWRKALAEKGNDYPMVFVTATDASAFCRWLSTSDGIRYSIPTEIQWEFACRAGSTVTSPREDLDLQRMVNRPWALTMVGQVEANPFGMKDMLGNVFEMAQASDDSFVLRGGAHEAELRPAARGVWQTIDEFGNYCHGFRVAIVGDLRKVVEAQARRKAASPANTQPVKLRSFTPGKDPLPLPHRGPAKAVTVVGDAWRIENTNQAGNFNVMVAQDVGGIPKDGVLVFRAKVKVEAKHKDAWGDLGFGAADQVFISWKQWPSVRARYDGNDSEWTEKEVRYPAAEIKTDPRTVYLYAGLHADGVLWLKDVELLYLPPSNEPAGPAAATPVKLQSFPAGRATVSVGIRNEGDSNRIDNEEPRDVTFFHFNIAKLPRVTVDGGVLWMKAQVKTEGLVGRVRPELTARWADGRALVTETGEELSGSQDWTWRQARLPLKRGQRPDFADLEFFVNGKGKVWVKDIELIYDPPGAGSHPGDQPPAERIKVFTTRDMPLSPDVPGDNRSGWRIEAKADRVAPLFEVAKPLAGPGTLVWRAKMKTDAVEGEVSLEAVGTSAASVEPVRNQTRGTGANDWIYYQVALPLKDGQTLSKTTLNVVFKGKGTVWIKDVELLKRPAASKDTAPVETKDAPATEIGPAPRRVDDPPSKQ